jgi:hypothetical protein
MNINVTEADFGIAVLTLLSFSIEPNFNQVNNLKLEPVLLPFI